MHNSMHLEILHQDLQDSLLSNGDERYWNCEGKRTQPPPNPPRKDDFLHSSLDVVPSRLVDASCFLKPRDGFFQPFLKRILGSPGQEALCLSIVTAQPLYLTGSRPEPLVIAFEFYFSTDH